MMALLLLLPAACFAAAMAVNAMAFRPPESKEEPEGGRRFVFRSGKNRLTGFMWNEDGKRGRVILAHGMGTDAGYYLPELRHFAAAGYQTVCFEYSGYGGSTGHFYGFAQAVSDLKSAIEWLDDGTLPVILIGHSMGGYAVCAVSQCLSRPVSAIVAYAPFSSPGAAIAEMTRKMPGHGKLLRLLVCPVQHVLFGTRHELNGVDGLRAANAPALILQGSRDEEVRCAGCSVYARREDLAGSAVTFRLIEREDSCGHMTLVRKKDTQCVNADTMKLTDAFLDEVLGET